MKRITVIMLFVVLLFAITSLVFVSVHQQKYYARGRFRLGFPNGAYIYNSYQRQLQTISNVLCSSESSNVLATMSQVQSSDFWLVKVQPIRGVSLVEVHYAGTDSNGVERVASNACVLIKAFYSTNQPTFHITDIEAGRYSPKPWWQRIIDGLTFDELTALFQR